jgi:hypothetical protein
LRIIVELSFRKSLTHRTVFFGVLPRRKGTVKTERKAQPFYHRPYPVPHADLQVFKEEADRLEELGVLSKVGPSKYLSPTFIIPPKDGRVRWVSDFRKLSSMIIRKYTTSPGFTTSYEREMDMFTLPNWTSQCNITHLNSMTPPRNGARYVHPLATVVTIDYLCESSKLQMLPNK